MKKTFGSRSGFNLTTIGDCALIKCNPHLRRRGSLANTFEDSSWFEAKCLPFNFIVSHFTFPGHLISKMILAAMVLLVVGRIEGLFAPRDSTSCCYLSTTDKAGLCVGLGFDLVVSRLFVVTLSKCSSARYELRSVE